MSKVFIALLPRDGLFCKDARGWHTSASGRGYSVDWPWPSTLLGAIRTAWGRMEEQDSGIRFGALDWLNKTAHITLGRTLTLRRPHDALWSQEHRVWPVPADTLWLEGDGGIQGLDPVPADVHTLGRDDDPAREALWRPRIDATAKAISRPRWWGEAEFMMWLQETLPKVKRTSDCPQIERRIQVHVGIRDDIQTADEGVLFSHDVLETLERKAEWAVGIEIECPSNLKSPIATVGSDSRIAQVENLSPSIFEPPPDLIARFNEESPGLRLVTVTPACFRRGWLPDGLEPSEGEYRGFLPGVEGEVVLRAAFVPRPMHISGWDMAANGGRGAPKPTRRMVAPGAVYFFERVGGRPFGQAEARLLWMAQIGQYTEEGFGCVVPGIWTPRGGD